MTSFNDIRRNMTCRYCINLGFTAVNKLKIKKKKNEFSEHDCSSKAFIRALVVSLCRTCLVDTNIDDVLFKKRKPILSKYVTTEALELDTLNAVQSIDHRTKHLTGFIRKIFDILYDEDIIRENVFYKWKDETREEGHAISVLSLKSFFDWLSESDEAPK